MERLIVDYRLEEEPLSAVLARVAYRLIVRSYHLGEISPADPWPDVVRLSNRLHLAGFRALSTWVVACAWTCADGGPSALRWRDGAVLRSRVAQFNRRRGEPWKRVPPCY